jgi:hypothetical protein
VSRSFFSLDIFITVGVLLGCFQTHLGAEALTMKNWHMFAYLGVGVLLALIAPVNSVVAGFMTPVLSAITSGKGQYV